MGLVEVEVADGVGLLRLNDPARRNAITAPLVAEIVAAVARLEADPEVGALVVTGAPPGVLRGIDAPVLLKANLPGHASKAPLVLLALAARARPTGCPRRVRRPTD